MTVGPDTVSVVIPTHNRAALLPRAMRSVLAQTYRDLELIVVDDASTDDTERVVASFDDPRIRYIRHDGRRGAAAARNAGIRAARGAYIAFQDSDDEWLLEKLDKQMQVLRANGRSAEVVYCGFLRWRGGSAHYVPEPSVTVRQGDILTQLLLGNFVSTQTLLLRRQCIENAGGFDERLARFQDWELAIRLAKAHEFRCVDEPLVLVHETPGNITGDDAAGIRALEIILEKHDAELRQNPATLASRLRSLGHMKCIDGALADGRRHFYEAVKVQPQNWKAWAALALALLGAPAYRLAAAARRPTRSS